ncbi:hypothetical protein BD779DRAFT_473905 [Infundibulicybe gibba]|nr:hypothetical protein BD779DRAFT_473905 [Infundibulicybe gibba]
MFKHSKFAQCFIIATYSSAIAASITLLILVLLNRSFITPLSALSERVNLVGCPVHSLTKFWYLYIPAFSLHTVLYIFTLIQVLSCRNSPKALLIRRLHRDGGFFYLVVVAAVGYTEIGSAMLQDPATNIPAIFAGFLLAATSISISRVMLSFHELAEYLKNDPNRLGFVNNIPLQKVNWTKGNNDGEFLVVGSDGPRVPSSPRSPLSE